MPDRLFLEKSTSFLDRVSTVRGSGWVNAWQSKLFGDIARSSFDPSATADGTDPIQVRFELLGQSLRDQSFHLNLWLITANARQSG